VPYKPDETPTDELQRYVQENRDLLTRVLRHGDTEARGYALALLAKGGTEGDIEEVQQVLEGLNDAEE
jgi:hypothetical protein